MNRYSRIFYHIDAKDVKEKHLENLAVQKADEEKVKQILEGIKNNNSPEYSDWRWDINEAMSTGGFQQTTYPASGETALDTITTNTTDVFGDASDLVDGGTEYAANLGTEIKDRGSGTGQSGGFDIDKHLVFDGDTDYRWAILHAVDSTTYDTMIVTAIRGNDNNGGEDPDEAGAQLELWYQIVGKTTEDRFLPIDYQYDGTTQDTSVTPTIIPVGSGVGNLREWTVKLPPWVRGSDTKFMLYQQTSSGTGWDNYGITKIQYRRTLPISVVVGLDSPEASVFMRVSQAPKLKQTKKKRRKELENQLRAGEQYTTKQFGDAFPGSKTTLGPDPEGSPIGSEQVKRTWETQEKQPTGLERSKALDSALKGKQPGQTKTLSTFKQDQKAAQQSDVQQKQIQQVKTSQNEKRKVTQNLSKIVPELKGKEVKDISSALKELASADKHKFTEEEQELIDRIDKDWDATDKKVQDIGNYKVNIAKSILLNKPIHVDPDSISQKDKLSYIKNIDLNQIGSVPSPDGRTVQGIPIVSTPLNYSDANIYVDDDGNVHSNRDGSRPDYTASGEYDKRFSNWFSASVAQLDNPLAARGKAQVQIVIPEDGSEPYLRYTDHAYQNRESHGTDEKPSPVIGWISDRVDDLGNMIHRKGKSGAENTDAMKGYPKNLRGDVVTQFDIPLSDLPKEFQAQVEKMKESQLKMNKDGERVGAGTGSEVKSEFDPPGKKYSIPDEGALSPEDLKRLDAPGRNTVTVNGKRYMKFGDLPWSERAATIEAYNQWVKDIDKATKEWAHSITAKHGHPKGWRIGTTFEPGDKEYSDYKKIIDRHTEVMRLKNEKSREISQRIVEVDKDLKPVTPSAEPTPREKAPERSDFPNTRSGAQKYMDAKKAYEKETVEMEKKAGEKAVDDTFNIDEYQSPESVEAMLNFRKKDPEGFKKKSLDKILSDNELDPRFEYVKWAQWQNINNNSKNGWPWATAVADNVAKQIEKGQDVRPWTNSMYGAKIRPSENYQDKIVPWVYIPTGKAWQDHKADLQNQSKAVKAAKGTEAAAPQRSDYPNTRSGAKQYTDDKKAYDKEKTAPTSRDQTAPTPKGQTDPTSAPQRSDFPNTRSGAKQYTDAKKYFEKIETKAGEKAVDDVFNIDEPSSPESTKALLNFREKDPEGFKKKSLEKILSDDELDPRFEYTLWTPWENGNNNAAKGWPWASAVADAIAKLVEKGVEYPLAWTLTSMYGAKVRGHTYKDKDGEPKTEDWVYLPKGQAWQDHLADTINVGLRAKGADYRVVGKGFGFDRVPVDKYIPTSTSIRAPKRSDYPNTQSGAKQYTDAKKSSEKQKTAPTPAPQRSDYPNTRSGAKQYTDDKKSLENNDRFVLLPFGTQRDSSGKETVTAGEYWWDKEDLKAWQKANPKDAKKVMDVGGAKHLISLDPDDAYSNTADEKVNRIVSKSQGNINSISDSDLQYLMDKGYPIDDWLYGGKTGSPVGELAMLGLSAAAVKAALPAVIKAGGSLVNLVKSEWGMRAITDSAYKTFEATGKMPPWYHWAAHKLLPQPVLNVFAKMTGTEAAKSILYTKGTAAGSALWRTMLASGAAATVQKLMFDGKTDQANDIIKNEWVKQTDEKINQMSSDKVSSELNQMFDADEAGTLQKYETVLDNDPGWKVFNNKWERLEKDIDTQIDAHNKTYESLEPLEAEEYKAYREYNSAAWGGYQDRETNTWVKTPELEWSKETEEQSFARAGVSYASYESAIKSAGTDSSGEIANYKQIMNGESGLTGLAGKVVKIGDKLKKNEADLARGRRTTTDKAQYDKWKAAEVKQEGLIKEYEAAFDLWEKESEKISKVYNSVRDKNTKAREELKKKYNDLKLKLDNAQKESDAQLDEIQKLIDEQENMDATDIINKIDRKFLMNINKDAIDEAFNKMPSSSFQPKKQKEFKIAGMTNYERGLIKGGQVPYMSPGRARQLLSDPEIQKMDDDMIIRQLQRMLVDKGDGGGGRLPLKHLKKQQAYSIDQPIIATTPSKKKRRVVSASYKLQGTPIMEKKLKKPKQFFNQADIKPLFPEDPPPKLKNGWHPRYGKVANRFNKLDPQSAKAMPPTGDPEIDTKVRKAAKKPK